jgi:hypothetical protein
MTTLFVMNSSVTAPAKREEILQRIVPQLFGRSNSSSVNVMNVRSVIVAALAARKTVALQGLKMILISVLCNELCAVATSCRTVKHVGPGARDHSSADLAWKRSLTRFAAHRSIVARMELFAAAVTSLGVSFGAHISPTSLTGLASRLNRMMDGKGRRAGDAGSCLTSFFHARKLSYGCV